MPPDSYFRVDAADLQSGREVVLVLAAASSEAAERSAQRGLLVSSVRAATEDDRQTYAGMSGEIAESRETVSQNASKTGDNAQEGEKAKSSAAAKSPFSNEAMPGGAPPLKRWFPGTLSNSAPRIPPRTAPADNGRAQPANNVARAVIPPPSKPASPTGGNNQPQKRPGNPPPTIPKPIRKGAAPARPRPPVTPSRGIPPIRSGASTPSAPPDASPNELIGPAKSAEKSAARPLPADVEPVAAPSPVIPVLDAPTLLELPKEKSGSPVPQVSFEPKSAINEAIPAEESPAPEPLSPGYVFQVSPSSGLAMVQEKTSGQPSQTIDTTGSEAAMERIASLIAAEVPMPLPEAHPASIRRAEPQSPAQPVEPKAVPAPEPPRPATIPSASVQTRTKSTSGNWLAVVFLAPLAFLSLAGGVFVLAYVLSRADPADLSDIQKVDLHLQVLAQSFLGGMLVLAGLLLFVAAGLVYVGSGASIRSIIFCKLICSMAPDDSFLLGVNYWPRRKAMFWWSDFDAGEVREEFAMIRAIGLSYVRIFLLWESFQPNPAPASIRARSNLRTVCDIAAELGLKIQPTFFTGHMSGPNWVPPWLLCDQPRKKGDRQIVSLGSQKNGNREIHNIYTEPFVIEAEDLQLRTICNELSDHPAIWSWSLGNEPDLFCRPPDVPTGARWVEDRAAAIRLVDPHHPVLIGLHCASLDADVGFRVDQIAKVTDISVMHGYSIYHPLARLSARSGSGSIHLLPDCGPWHRPVLYEEFGANTCWPDQPSHWKNVRAWDGTQRRIYFASEEDGAAYYASVLPELQRVGARRARFAGVLGITIRCFGTGRLATFSLTSDSSAYLGRMDRLSRWGRSWRISRPADRKFNFHRDRCSYGSMLTRFTCIRSRIIVGCTKSLRKNSRRKKSLTQSPCNVRLGPAPRSPQRWSREIVSTI